MEISEILKQIKENKGIQRQRVNLNTFAKKDLSLAPYENAENSFIEIANSLVAWKGKPYDAESVKETIRTLIHWAYLLDARLDYTKGILLKGSTGRGKTMLLTIFSNFLKIDQMKYKSNGQIYSLFLQIVHAKKIASDYQKEGYAALEKYSNIPCLMIDDIGSEMDESNNFGNKINVIESVLDMREAKNLLTFGTTNLNKFSDKYDDRTISRMNGLFNVVGVNHKTDYRR